MTQAPAETAPAAAANPPALHMTDPGPPPAPGEWGVARRIAFRFASIYLFLNALPFPAGVPPGTSGFISDPYHQAWHTVVPWVGRHVLHLDTDITVFPNGSGDTTYNYVQLLCFLALAAVGATGWSVLARNRTRHDVAHGLLRIYLRYSLAFEMLSYGLLKVFWLQFSAATPEKLVEPLGEYSPMGLLWTFMGYSRGYNLFTGGLEVVGGLLLLFRRTTPLGALVVAAVMTNVVALNLAYDVPVKIYSSHLLLMSLFLLLPELRRIANVLVLNRPTQPVVFRTPFAHRWAERGSRAAKVLFAGWVLYANLSDATSLLKNYGADVPQHPLYGVYEIEAFTRDGQERPVLAKDAAVWRYVLVGTHKRLSLRFMDDTGKRFLLEDLPEQRLKLSAANSYPGEKDPETFTLTWSRPDPEHLTVEGVFRDAPIHARLRKVDPSKFRLVSRGFHWVQEYPFNR